MISNEQQLLIKLLRGERPASLEGINCNELFSLFQRHRLFYLATLLLDLLEEQERIRWKEALQTRTVKSLYYTAVLGKLLAKFKQMGIEVIPIKGPVLVKTLYGDAGQRQFRDLDLLVDLADIKRSLKILKESGYELMSPKKEFTQKEWEYYYRYKYDVELIHSEQRHVVELHCGVYYPTLFEVTSKGLLLRDLMDLQLGQHQVKCMNHENTLLYLAIHGGHHLYFRLFWLRDVAEAIRKWELDHQTILETARNLKLERLLVVSILLAHDIFGVEIPAAYDTYKDDARVLNRLKVLCTRAIYGSGVLTFRRKLERLFFYMLLRPGLRYKWAVAKSLVHRWVIRTIMDRKRVTKA